MEDKDCHSCSMICRNCKYSALNWDGYGLCRNAASPINIDGYGTIYLEQTCKCYEERAH